MCTASRVVTIFLLGICFSPTAVTQTYTYRITEIETAGTAQGRALNNQGKVTGTVLNRCNDCSVEAFLWAGNKAVSYFGPLADDFQWVRSDGFDINYLGQVTGQAILLLEPGSVLSEVSRALFWDGATKTILGTLGGSYSSGAAINASGHIAGTSLIVGDAEYHAFLWDGTAMRDLGTLGGNFSGASGINGSGHVTGTSNIANGEPRAFLWDRSTMHDLGTLGGSRSFGAAVNNKGQVAGRATTTDDVQTHAFLWDDGVMQDIGTLGGYSEATAINNSGQVVGFFVSSNRLRGFLWENDTMKNVNKLNFANDPLKPFVTLTWARDINNLGQMLIEGFHSEHLNIKSFLISPSYTLSAFFAPTRNSWQRGSTVRIAIAALDANGVLIPDARAALLIAEPGCRVKVSATGSQTLASTCMKYNATTNAFWFDWELAGTGLGTAIIDVRVNYGAPGPLKVRKTRSISITN
jgi:probable HAF family extracellular repeat protein